MMILFIASILFSASVGHWVETSPNRLRTLRATILVNRGSVILGSIIWLLILSQENLVAREDNPSVYFVLGRNDILKGALFAVAICFGIIERLSASGNMISMERDWVVTLAAPAGHTYDLTHLNAVMRRIDLVCKLISPVVISAVISAVGSMRFGVVFTGLTSLVCLPIELLSAKRAWSGSKALQEPKLVPLARTLYATETTTRTPGVLRWATEYIRRFGTYFSTSVWVPSLACSLLRYSMLTWRPTFITYLINIGYSLNFITLARAIGSVFEISSTVVTPMGVRYFGDKRDNRSGSSEEAEAFIAPGDDGTGEEEKAEARTLVGLQRCGFWGFFFQVLNLVSHSRTSRRGSNMLRPRS